MGDRRTLKRLVLDPERVIATLDQLHARIDERFPDSGLSVVCADLTETAAVTAKRAAALKRPYFGLQALVGLVIAAAGGVTLVLASRIDWLSAVKKENAISLTQGLDSAMNLGVLTFGALWFLGGLEKRWKRSRALNDLYRLRAFAHVIDMHQLTKDPSAVLSGAAPTASSPVRRMTEGQLLRYLDYCAELLALISKLAALYAASSRDPDVIAAVNDIEDLTSNLGRKIWQKITILSQLSAADVEQDAGLRTTIPSIE